MRRAIESSLKTDRTAIAREQREPLRLAVKRVVKGLVNVLSDGIHPVIGRRHQRDHILCGGDRADLRMRWRRAVDRRIHGAGDQLKLRPGRIHLVPRSEESRDELRIRLIVADQENAVVQELARRRARIVRVPTEDLPPNLVDATHVREYQGADGERVRGLLVEVEAGQYRRERSFVDADEIPELLRGIEALLALKQNPTSFQFFEHRYTTKGELQITVYNGAEGIRYSIRAGRIIRAEVLNMTDGDLQKFRSLIASAQTRIQSLPK